MSIRDRTFTSGKKCFSYCGDDRCNCDAHPEAQGWLNDLADAPSGVTATGVSADPGGTETKPEQNLHEKGSEG